MPTLLFDLDGTLLVSDPVHEAVFRDLWAEYGLEVEDDFYVARIHGRHNSEIFPEFLPGEDAVALDARKEAMFRARLPRPYPAMPGAAALVARAQARGWPHAIVTNAMRPNTEAMLGAIGLAEAFDTIVTADEHPPGKPDPHPYRVAMRLLGVAPHDCIAFEDSPPGVAAARGSGAFTIGIRSALGHDALVAAGAHTTIQDFNDPALASLLEHPQGDHS